MYENSKCVSYNGKKDFDPREEGLMFDFETPPGIEELMKAKIAHDIEVREREEAKLQEKKEKVVVRKRKMPTPTSIKKYWEGKFRFIEDYGWKELPTNACWRCGTECKPDRAHIWARWCMETYTDKTDKEIDDVSNLHLLCSSCHQYSENYHGWAPGLAYYEWFYSLREPLSLNPRLPQVYRENRFFGIRFGNELIKRAKIDTSEDREPTKEEEKRVIEEGRKIIDDGHKTGNTILCKKDYEGYLKSEYKEDVLLEGVIF